MAQQQQQSDGILTWALIGCACLGVMGIMAWIIASHLIVYYMTPVVDSLAFPWRWIPGGWAKDQITQLNFNYVIFRRHPAHISFTDWLQYVNLGLKPWVLIFTFVAIWLFIRQNRYIKAGRMNEKMTPENLAGQMMRVFTDIAPVVKLQHDLVANRLSRWKRQIFPHEFIEKARHQGKSVLVRDSKRGGLTVDQGRLDAYLRTTKKYKQDGIVFMRSRFLGRQIVDLSHDIKNPPAFPDRLSDAGKAIFAILAPYAFNANKGKVQSKEVADALNFSAYGSEQGMANLSLPIVQKSFDQWRDYPLAKKIAKIHHWEHTYLFALLEHAQRSGKIGTWNFIWLKPTNRIMFYVLNSVGRKTPHSEASLAFSQYQFEKQAAQMGRLPITPQGKPVIFTGKVLDALVEEWEFWRTAEDNDDDWWKKDESLDWENNDILLRELGLLEQSQKPPVGTL